MPDHLDWCGDKDCGDRSHLPGYQVGYAAIVPEDTIHNDGIEHICDALLASGLWQEIDGDGTEYSIIADRIVELILYLTEAIDLLRHPNEHDVGAFLSDLPAALFGRKDQADDR